MANSFSQLVQPLIDQTAIEYLRHRNGFLDKIYIETVQSDIALGGNSAIITLPNSTFSTTDVSTSVAPVPQNITLPSATVTFSNWKEVVINLSELEARTARGNAPMILKNTAMDMMDALLRGIDAAVGLQYVNASQTVGAYNKALDNTDGDATLRSAIKDLMDKFVDPHKGNVYFVTSTKGLTDMLGIANYVTALNIGQVQNPSAVITGRISRLFDVGVDYSNNVATATVSATANYYSLMFEKFAFAMGIQKFSPINQMGNSYVQESYITDPFTGLQIRSWLYLDASIRQWVIKYDIKWGVTTLDATRAVSVQHK